MLQSDTSWRAVRNAANFEHLRFHDLRHTVLGRVIED
jgi:hypothetical protein